MSAIYFHPYYFLATFGIVTGLTLWEFYGLVKHYENAAIKRFISSIGGAYLFIATFCYANGLVGGDIFLPYLLILMYAIARGLDPDTQRPVTLLNGEEVESRIRTMEVSSHVSPVATLGFVREALVRQQQAMGKEKGIVMDGRDIGTVVFPEAELKIFVTASAEIRAQRRYDELKAKGEEASFKEILHNVEERDRIDQTRKVSPLRKADDALLLDNSHLSIAEQKEWLKSQYERIVHA